VPIITDKLIEQLPHGEATFARQRRAPLPLPDVSAMAGPRRPIDPNDSNEAGLHVPVHHSTWIKILALLSLLALLGYVGIRLWDLSKTHQDEKSGWRTFYRVLVIFVELIFGGTGLASLISRTQRQRLESLSNASRDLPFTINDVIAILTVTDEDERAITASVESHYKASKASANGTVLPFRVVIVAETSGRETAATQAVAALQPQYPNLLLFNKKELAEQVPSSHLLCHQCSLLAPHPQQDPISAAIVCHRVLRVISTPTWINQCSQSVEMGMAQMLPEAWH
jgi:hypothetical protein